MVLGLRNIYITRWDIVKTGTFTYSDKALPLYPFLLLHSELLGTRSISHFVVSLISIPAPHYIEPAVLHVVTISYFGFEFD